MSGDIVSIHKMNTNKNKSVEISDKYVTSGTLGDMFAVYCKIAGLRRDGFKQPIQLRHYTKFAEFRDICTKLITLLPDVSVDFEPFTRSEKETVAKVCEAVSSGVPHINGKYNGKSPIPLLDDPGYVRMEPFPEVVLPLNTVSPRVNDGKFHVGIQLHSGKLGGNFKGFSLNWLKNIVNRNNNELVEVHLLGTGAGYRPSKIDAICHGCGMNNHVGETGFYEWMDLIKKMDLFITPEGFSAFFAQSQQVKTLAFFSNYNIVSRIPPEWRTGSFFLSCGQEKLYSRIKNRFCRALLKRDALLAPLSEVQTASILHSEFFARIPVIKK